MSHDDHENKPADPVTEIAAIEERLEVLRIEHRALDQRLHELEKHLSLTPLEQQEVARIKKQKLHKKDEISRVEGHLRLLMEKPAPSS